MRDYKLYLDDIIEAAKRIEKYTKGLILEKFKKDNLIIDGVVRNLEIIARSRKKYTGECKREIS